MSRANPMRSTYSKWVNIVAAVVVVVASLITACKLQCAMRGGNGNGSVVVGACAVTVVVVAERVKVDAIVKESANAGLEHETKC